MFSITIFGNREGIITCFIRKIFFILKTELKNILKSTYQMSSFNT